MAMHKKDGLNDSDKILVTIALWICAATMFVTALTLPMLPSQVTIFYRPLDTVTADESYSKFNNLFLILITLIPTAIALIIAALKQRNRLQNNFISLMLFDIMLAISMSSVIIYGISQQFDSSSSVKDVNLHGIIAIAVAFVFSVVSSTAPLTVHRRKNSANNKTHSAFMARIGIFVDKYWAVGAYGYLVAAIFCAFVPDYFAYIPLAAGVVAYAVCVLVYKPSVKAVGAEKQSA